MVNVTYLYNPSDSLLVLNQPSQSPTNSIYKSLSRLWRYKTAYFSGIGMLLDTIYDLRETIEKKIYFILQTKYISYRSIRPMKYRPILR